MRKIDKSGNLSTKYKEWLDAKEAAGETHPKYRSDFRFYNDIKFDLLRCQNGLCAYTETRLYPLSLLTEDYWEDGKYKFEKDVTKAAGQVEHFDSTLKEHKGWLWDNLFVSDSDVNRDKSTASIDNIMKPDLDNYDPLDRMDFDERKMVYIANEEKTEEEQERISQMIKVLGINYPGHVKTRREEFFNRLKRMADFGVFEIGDYEDSEFPTIVRIIIEQYLPNQQS